MTPYEAARTTTFASPEAAAERVSAFLVANKAAFRINDAARDLHGVAQIPRLDFHHQGLEVGLVAKRAPAAVSRGEPALQRVR